MEKELQTLQEQVLELKVELANMRKLCDNYEERISELESGSKGSGIYLDGVQEAYRLEILKSIK